MNAAQREAWYIENEALVQFYAYKVLIWKVGSGMVEGSTPEEAILHMQQTMSSGRPRLSFTEAERRVNAAVDELEATLNRVDQTPDKHDEDRRAYLYVSLMNLLREQYAIMEDS